MPAQRKLSAQDKARLLRNLPEGTTRIQVVDSNGKTSWKKPADVDLQDQITLNNDGEPIVMRGQPGRKAKIALPPADDAVAEIQEAKSEHFRDDPLTTIVAKDPEADEVLNLVMTGLAEEAASLEFERQEAERKGKDTSTYSLRRGNLLKLTGELWLKRRERLQEGHIDMDSPAFQALFSLLLETLKGAMEDAGVRTEHVETTFTKLAKRLNDRWKQEAKARMKESL